MSISAVSGVVAQEQPVVAKKSNVLSRIANLFVTTKEEALDKIPEEFSVFNEESDSEESVESVEVARLAEAVQPEVVKQEEYVLEKASSDTDSNTSDASDDEFADCLFRGDNSL